MPWSVVCVTYVCDNRELINLWGDASLLLFRAPLVLQGPLVIAPYMQPAHFGALTVVRRLGMVPSRVRIRRRANDGKCPNR